MKYSLFFNILFIGLCGVYAKDRHIRSLPRDKESMSIMVSDLLKDDKKPDIPQINPDCPVPPLDCPNDNITFWYYSRAIGKHPLPIRYAKARSTGLKKSTAPWKLIIPGFTHSKEKFPVQAFVSAYNKKGYYNILVVDYFPLATPQCFFAALQNIPLIAKCTGDMLEYLTGHKVFTLEKLHVIGFGFGSHIAGSLHKYIGPVQLGRITALDPYFLPSIYFPSIELSEKSGQFVDVFHTNAIMRETFPPAGHAEFFFNSGVVQPGCYIGKYSNYYQHCSHERSVHYYVESIKHSDTDNGFYGIPCDNYWFFIARLCKGTNTTLAKAGEDVNMNARGKYYSQTYRSPEFAFGKQYEYIPGARGGSSVGNNGTGSSGGNYGTGSSGGNYGTGSSGGNYGTGSSGWNHGTGSSGWNLGTGSSGWNHGTGSSGWNHGTGSSGWNHGTGSSGWNHGTGSSGWNHGTGSSGGNDGTGSDGGNDGTGSDGGNDGTGSDEGNDGTGSDGGNDGTGSDGGNDGTGSDGWSDGTGSDGWSDGTGSDGGSDGTGSDGWSDGTGSDGGSDGTGSDGGSDGTGSDGGNDGTGSDGWSDGTGSDGWSDGTGSDGWSDGTGSDGGSDGTGSDGGHHDNGAKEDGHDTGANGGHNSNGSNLPDECIIT